MSNLKTAITTIIARYHKHTDYYQKNEHAVRSQLINPILKVLDWDVEDPDKIIPEQTDKIGKQPDYTFYRDSKKVLILEAKNASKVINEIGIIHQLDGYCRLADLRYGLLSNGISWLLYDVFEIEADKRIIWELNLLKTTDDYETEIRQLEMLAYDRFKDLEQSIRLEQFINQHFSTAEKIDIFIDEALKTKTGGGIEEAYIQKLKTIMLNKYSQKAIPQVTEAKSKREKATKIKVTFPAGTVIAKSRASETLSRVIEKIGIEKVWGLDLKMSGKQLVSRAIQNHKGANSPHKIGDYYVTVHSNTATKIEVLETISRKLDLNLQIEKI